MFSSHSDVPRQTNQAQAALLGYGIAVAATTLVLVVRLLLNPVLGGDAPLLAFVLAVMLAARYGGLGPGLLATLLSVLVGIYFFLPPYYVFAVPSKADMVRIALFVAVGTLVSVLSQGLRAAKENAEADKDEKARLLSEVQDGPETRAGGYQAPADVSARHAFQCDGRATDPV